MNSIEERNDPVSLRRLFTNSLPKLFPTRGGSPAFATGTQEKQNDPERRTRVFRELREEPLELFSKGDRLTSVSRHRFTIGAPTPRVPRGEGEVASLVTHGRSPSRESRREWQ